MKLKELLDSPVEFSPLREVQGLIISFFDINGKHYVGAFHKDTPDYTQMAMRFLGIRYEFENNSDIYSYAFGLIPEGIDKNNTNQIMRTLLSNSVIDTTTNTGDTATVFSTVVAMCKSFFNQYKPNGFYFGAKEENRLRVYDIICRKLVAGSNEYTYTNLDAAFVIEKKQ